MQICWWSSSVEQMSQPVPSSPQAAGRRHSPTPSPPLGLPTPWRPHAARATWATAAATGRNRATTTRRRAGNGADAPRTSNTASSSPASSWMPGRLKKMPDGWWTFITMKLAERWGFFLHKLQYLDSTFSNVVSASVPDHSSKSCAWLHGWEKHPDNAS